MLTTQSSNCHKQNTETEIPIQLRTHKNKMLYNLIFIQRNSREQ